MNMLKKIWESPIVRRVVIVGAVILAFFLTLYFTLPDIQRASGNTPTVTPGEDADATLTPDSTANGTQTEATPVLVDNPDQVGTQFTKTFTLKSLGIDEVVLKGLYASNSVWIELPTNWIVENLQVNLHYVPSPVLFPDRANLNILVNGQEFTSLNLSGEEEQVLSFEVPGDYIEQGDGFLLSFKGYLRVTDLICEETDNPGQWVRILDSTEFVVQANPINVDLLLENMNILMHEQEDSDATTFIIPDSPDADALATTAKVAARLGFNDGTATPNIIMASEVDQSDLSKSNIVVIGTPDQMPLLEQLASSMPAPLEGGSFITLDGQPAPEEHGVVQIMRSPWNESHTVLIVSGGSQAGLALAENAFASKELFDSLTGEFEFVKTEYPLTNAFDSTPWRFTPASLSDFQFAENRELGGLGESTEVFYLRWPPGWTVADGAQFHLSLIFSPVIAPNSHVVVRINDAIAGVGTIDTSQTTQEFVFELSPEVINQTLWGEDLRTMRLQIKVISILDVDECAYGNDITGWVQIDNDSYFTMSHGYSGISNLQTFPYPYVSDKDIQPTVVVLPDEPTTAEIAQGLAVIKQLGDYTLDDIDISILTASQLNQTEYSGANLIVLGTVDRQPWVMEFLRSLPQIPEDGVYQALNDENIGLIVEGTSPWSASHTALVIVSQSSKGVDQGITELRELYELDEPTYWVQFTIK